MKELVFPTLRPEEIEVKVKQISEKGAVLLLYKNARVDMNLLDKVAGPFNWSCSYRDIKGVLYCEISIFDEERNIWVSKEDCGIESRPDEEGNEKKGEASDSFKRAGFRWNISRELYTAPFIFAKVETTQRNGKWALAKFMTFSVSSIDYDEERNIKGLTIVDNDGNVVFSTKAPSKAPSKRTEKKPLGESSIDRLVKIDKITTFYHSLESDKKEKFNEWFKNRYNKPMGVSLGVSGMKDEQLDDAIKNIEKMS